MFKLRYRKIKITNVKGDVFRIILEKDAWKTPGTSCFSFARRVKYELIDAPVGLSDKYIKNYIERPLVGAIPWFGIFTEFTTIVEQGYFLVAVYRGLNDSHFVRLCCDGWYQTMGTTMQMGRKLFGDNTVSSKYTILSKITRPKITDYRFIGFWIFPFYEDYDKKDKDRLEKKKTSDKASDGLKLPPIV